MSTIAAMPSLQLMVLSNTDTENHQLLAVGLVRKMLWCLLVQDDRGTDGSQLEDLGAVHAVVQHVAVWGVDAIGSVDVSCLVSQRGGGGGGVLHGAHAIVAC